MLFALLSVHGWAELDMYSYGLWRCTMERCRTWQDVGVRNNVDAFQIKWIAMRCILAIERLRRFLSQGCGNRGRRCWKVLGVRKAGGIWWIQLGRSEWNTIWRCRGVSLWIMPKWIARKIRGNLRSEHVGVMRPVDAELMAQPAGEVTEEDGSGEQSVRRFSGCPPGGPS
jgi:hypothetical protein